MLNYTIFSHSYRFRWIVVQEVRTLAKTNVLPNYEKWTSLLFYQKNLPLSKWSQYFHCRSQGQLHLCLCLFLRQPVLLTAKDNPGSIFAFAKTTYNMPGHHVIKHGGLMTDPRQSIGATRWCLWTLPHQRPCRFHKADPLLKVLHQMTSL